MGELAPRSELTKNFMNGVGGIGAGVGLLIVTSLAQAPIFWVAAGICGVIGIGMVISKTQKKAGVALIAAAAIAAVAGFVLPALGWLGWIAGIGLIGLGGFSLFKFFSNMKKRT